MVTYSYDAWGNIISAEDKSGEKLVGKNPFTYRGYYRDNETGLYYLQSRYYDAKVGRFINADVTNVLSDMAGVSSKNLYIYSKNNVVNHIDPVGLKTVSLSSLALLLDTIIFLICLPAAVSFDFVGAAFKVACKHLLKKSKTTLKKAIKKVIPKISKKLKTGMNLIKGKATAISKKLPMMFKESIKYILSTLSSSVLNTLLKQICEKINYVFLLFSVGGIVALLCDVKQHKRITGKVTIW